MEKWKQQNTERGLIIRDIKDGMRRDYIKMGIPPEKIKTGNLIPLVDLRSGKIKGFIEN